MAIFHNENAMKPAVSDAAYSVDYSCRFDGASHLINTGLTGSNGGYTMACWIKRGNLGDHDKAVIWAGGYYSSGSSKNIEYFYFNDSDTLGFSTEHNSGSASITTDAVYRDPSAWMHTCVVRATGSASSNIKIYVNGKLAAEGSATSHAAQQLANYADFRIGSMVPSLSSRKWTGCIADVHFIDGTAIAPLDNFVEVSETTGQLVPIAYTADHGTNGFHIPFDNTAGSDVFTDSSGSNAATAFTDSSRACHHITRVGDATHSATEKKIGRTSMHFDGSDHLTVASHSDFSFGTGDFTLETWVYFTEDPTTTGTGLIGYITTPNSGYAIWISTDGRLKFYDSESNGNIESAADVVHSGNFDEWHHVAAVRSSGTIKIYFNGSEVASGSNTETLDFTKTLVLGTFYGNATSSYILTGYMDEIRISDTARYTTGFTPSTTAFADDENTLLLIHSDGIQHTITNGGDPVHARKTSTFTPKIDNSSMHFDGSDRLIVSGNSALSIPASTDFCIECWFYPTDVDTSGQVGLIMNRSSPSENGFWISQTDQNLDCRLAGTNAGGWEGVTTTTSNPLTLNTWHHIAYCRSGTGTDNITLYVDGVAEDTATSNAADDAAAGRDWVIGRFFTDADNSAYYIQGYLDEIRFSTGTPRYTGAGQTPTAAFTDDENTVLLIHSNYGGGIGGDDSGKTNDFAAGGNLAAHDQMVDTPSAGNNFCTWNPLGGATKGLYADLSDGNLRLDWSSASQAQAVGTIEMTSGKWYFEATINDVNWLNLGVSSDYAYDGSNWGDIYTIYTSTNNGYEVHHEGSSTGSWSGSAVTPAVGDVIGIAFDADNGKIWYSVNGSGFDSSSPDDTINPYSAGEKSWHVNMSAWQSSTNVNFGADHTFANQKTALVSPCTPDDGPGEFYYDVPAGFKALCTANLDAPGLNNAVAAEKAFEVITYEGNATETAIPHSGTSPTTMPFNADLIWGKNRSNSVGYHHGIADSVRGISSSSTPILKSSSSVGDIDTSAQIEGVSGNQITLGDNSDSNNYFNLNDDDYVIWAWKAGTAGTRVNGDINSNSTNYAESYNADAGFSIIKYDSGGSGSSMDDSGNMYDDLAHSLSSPVELGLFKMRNPDDGVGGGTQSWAVFHKDLDDGKNLSLDGTGDQSTDNNFVDPANVSSGSVLGDNHISLYYGESGTGSSGGYGVNRTNDQFATGQFIAYLFRSIDGYSKVGSWQSSGTSPLTEPFIYCGFRPAYVWVKRYEGSSSYGNWVVQDNKRNTHNVVDKWLFPNLADDEYTYTTMDFLSNGFKIRTTTGSNVNYSNWKYAFYAVAEIPFQYASAR